MSSFGLTEEGPVIAGLGFTVKSIVAVPSQLFVVPITVNVCKPEAIGVNVEPVITSPFPSFQT